MQVGGILFFADCASRSVNWSSIYIVNGYYESNNAYRRQGLIRIAGVGASFRCILTSFSISGQMTAYNYASFSLGFTLVPKKGT